MTFSKEVLKLKIYKLLKIILLSLFKYQFHKIKIMTNEEIEIIRSYIRENSELEYSIHFPNAYKAQKSNFINFEGLETERTEIIDSNNMHISWIEPFECWDDISKEIIGKTKVTFLEPDNKFVFAGVGTVFDGLGPIDSTTKYLMIEDLMNDKFTKLVVDGKKLF